MQFRVSILARAAHPFRSQAHAAGVLFVLFVLGKGAGRCLDGRQKGGDKVR